jgi:uncharacterized membrane protein YphA (DoxX/SURF4 family)
MISFKLINERYCQTIVSVFRAIVGLTFILSGTTKLIDPWGVIYKIGEYFTVWDFEATRAMLLALSVGLSLTELMLGILLVLGCYRRVVSWLSGAVMAFMLPLSLYIYLKNPVADCGCFGDFLIISNFATFAKNIVLSIAVVYLILYNTKEKALIHPHCQWMVVVATGIYGLILPIIGYTTQPLIDFRPFKEGTPLLSEADANPQYVYTYAKDGVEKEFTQDNLPDDTWTFVKREGVKAQGEAKDDNFFAVFDDEDCVSEDVISQEGEQIIALIPDLKNEDLNRCYLLNALDKMMQERDGSMIAVVNGSEEDKERWIDESQAQYDVYTADDTVIKMLARGDVAIVYLKDGNIVWKRNAVSLPSDLSDQGNVDLIKFKTNGHLWFAAITSVYLCLLGLIFAISVIPNVFLKKTHKKSVPLYDVSKEA